MTETDRLDEDVQEGVPQPGIAFAELAAGRCKFPLGAVDVPATRFCGAATPLGTVYCVKHQRIAYNRSADRRR